MALESASYIDGLVATNPTGSDPVAQADDHLRLLKNTLKATFPNITGEVSATHTKLNNTLDKTGDTMTGTLVLSGAPTANLHASTKKYVDDSLALHTPYLVPSGSILMWSGSIVSIPSGWLLCNGANGTPDLRDKFIAGAGSTYSVNQTGGASSVTASSSGSGVTGDASVVVGIDGWGTSGGPFGTGVAGRLVTASGSPEYAEGLESIRNAGTSYTTTAHNHTIGTHAHTVSTVPPFFALAYIMKT